jgi:16S rRNA (cytidine1402-2'-O)-methyltransferase
MPDPGTIYIVSTPIGNLEDITLRAVRILGEVDVIAAEDTRRTGKLLAHLNLTTRMVSYHDATEARRAPELLKRVAAGENLALVSDAGTPLVADPGFRLVSMAAAKGLRVVPVPGASAPLAILAVSGLPTDRFRFVGFLPSRAKARRDAIAEMQAEEDTLVLFETARRLPVALKDLAEILGERPAVVGRELTKKYEEIRRGTLISLEQHFRDIATVRGEIVMAIGRASEDSDIAERLLEAEARLDQRLGEGESPSRAARAVATELGLSRREVYGLAHRKENS